jgi:hypothetical protein
MEHIGICLDTIFDAKTIENKRFYERLLGCTQRRLAGIEE